MAGWVFSCLVYQTGVLGVSLYHPWARCQSLCGGEPNTRLCDQSLACEGEGGAVELKLGRVRTSARAQQVECKMIKLGRGFTPRTLQFYTSIFTFILRCQLSVLRCTPYNQGNMRKVQSQPLLKQCYPYHHYNFFTMNNEVVRHNFCLDNFRKKANGILR